jgi:hypothetical protein
MQQYNRLIAEQQVNNTNPLYELAYTSRDLQRVPEHSLTLHDARYTYKRGKSILNWYCLHSFIYYLYV